MTAALHNSSSPRRQSVRRYQPGASPQPADERLQRDQLIPAMVRWEGQLSDQLLETIDWCLNLNHLYRPQSAFALQKALVENGEPPPEKQVSETWLGQLVDKLKNHNKS